MHNAVQAGTRLAALESYSATDLCYYRARYYDPLPSRRVARSINLRTRLGGPHDVFYVWGF